MIVSSVQSYNASLQQLCLTELSQRGTTSLIDFRAMNKKCEKKWNKKSVEEGLELSTTLITKVNDIEATIEQLNNLLQTFVQDYADDVSDTTKMVDTVVERTNDLLDDVIDRITSQFRFPIESTFEYLINVIDTKLKNQIIDSNEFQKQFSDLVAKTVTELFEMFITPSLSILSRSLYRKLFERTLLSLFSLFCKCLELIYIPIRYIDGSYLYDKTTPSTYRIEVMLLLMEYIIEYFYGDGEGLSKETMSQQNQLLFNLISYEQVPTDQIISSFENGTVQLPESYVMGLLLLRNDASSEYLDQFRVKVIDNWIKYLYNIDTQLSDLITDTFFCWNEFYHYGYIYLTKTNHFLYESWSMKNFGTKNCIPHIKDPIGAKLSSFIHISKHVFKIDLADVIDVKNRNTLFHNSLLIKFASKNASLMTLHFPLFDVKLRNNVSKVLLQKLEKCNNRVDWKNHNPNASFFENLFAKKEDVVVQESVPVMTDVDREKIMLERFNISKRGNPKFISKMSGKLGTENVVLYLFSTCLLFTPLTTATTTSIYWYDVTSITTLDDTITVNTTTSTYEFQSQISSSRIVQQYESFRSKNSKELEWIISMRQGKSYDQIFNKLFNEKLIMTIECKLQRGFEQFPGRLFLCDKFLVFLTEENLAIGEKQDSIMLLRDGLIAKCIRWRITKEWILRLRNDSTRDVFVGGDEMKELYDTLVSN
jgi:hypothetical protein